MFNYTEKKTTYSARERRDAYVERLVTISDGSEPVGRIEIRYDLSGAVIPVDHWHKDKPVQVEYFDPESSDKSYRRTLLVDRCRNLAEGKKIFADWYKENKGIFRKNSSADVKVLPASPENEFYPTPSSLAGQMAALVDWDKVETILEPSAGKGDLIECAIRCAISRRWKRWREYERREKFIQNTDCIEIDENLRHILTGKGYRMVLRFKTDEAIPRHLAFCSERKTWTTKAPPAPDKYSVYTPIVISGDDYVRIMREINFNCYDYSEDLSKIVT